MTRRPPRLPPHYSPLAAACYLRHTSLTATVLLQAASEAEASQRRLEREVARLTEERDELQVPVPVPVPVPVVSSSNT